MKEKYSTGAILSPVVLTHYKFNDEGDRVPSKNTVSVVTEVREPGQRVKRIVHHMPPSLARRRAAELLEAAEEAEAKDTDALRAAEED